MGLKLKYEFLESRFVSIEVKILDEKFDHLEILSKLIKVDSCETLARNGIQTSGYYNVGLGNSSNPVKTYCDFEEKSMSIGEEIIHVVEHCPEEKCYNRSIPYEASYEQLRNLINSSPRCYQNVSFSCVSSPLQVRK